MSRPPVPKAGHSQHWADKLAIWLMAAVGAVWAAGWVVLTLAGARPQPNPLGAIVRLAHAARAAVLSRPTPGGWVAIWWAPARPVSEPGVAVVIAGLLLAALTVAWLVRRVTKWWEARRGGGGGSTPGSVTGTGQSLDEWLAEQQGADS